jgi:hypothetical protein
MIWRILAMVLLAVCTASIGLKLWRGLQSGELEIGEDGPPIFLSKATHPKGYWVMTGVFAAMIAVCLWCAVDLLVKSSS